MDWNALVRRPVVRIGSERRTRLGCGASAKGCCRTDLLTDASGKQEVAGGDSCGTSDLRACQSEVRKGPVTS